MDRRVYNQPTSDEIAIIIPGFGENNGPKKRDALCFEKNGKIKIINPNQAAYDPMMYPLIFPTGQLGWEPNTIKLTLPNEIEEEEQPTTTTVPVEATTVEPVPVEPVPATTETTTTTSTEPVPVEAASTTTEEVDPEQPVSTV